MVVADAEERERIAEEKRVAGLAELQRVNDAREVRRHRLLVAPPPRSLSKSQVGSLSWTSTCSPYDRAHTSSHRNTTRWLCRSTRRRLRRSSGL